MAETTSVLVIKTRLSPLVPVGTGIKRSGIGSMMPDMNETGIEQETEMILQIAVVTGMTDVMILGKNTGAMMVIRDLGKTQGRGITFLAVIQICILCNALSIVMAGNLQKQF